MTDEVEWKGGLDCDDATCNGPELVLVRNA